MLKSKLKLLLSTALGLAVLVTTPVLAKQDTRREIQEKNETVGEYLDDAGTTAKIKTALVAKPNLKARNIHVITTQGVAELSGEVRNQGEKNQAEKIARENGAKDVINKLEIRDIGRESAEKKETTAEYLDDTAVTTKVKGKLATEPNFDASDITVTTVQNSVELKGTVRSEAEKKRAEDIARGVSGANEIVNKLTVR